MNLKKLNSNRGITLVALIITVIVLLILAMVSISLVMNSGLINKSKHAVDKYSQEEVQEQIKLAYSEWQMGQYMGNTDTASEFIDNKLEEVLGLSENDVTVAGSFKITIEGKEYLYNAKTGQMVDSEVDLYSTVTATTNNSPVSENSKYVSGTYTAVIPAGYTISNVAAEQSIENGLVIKKDGNEWVWIPVANVTDLYNENTTNTEWILCGTSGDNKVVSSYASKSEILSGVTRITPGLSSGYREPDMLNNTKYDNKQTYWSSAGFTSYISMATSLKDDYKNMIDSIRKYGGFYVGRYELGGSVYSPKVQDGQTVLNNTNWYTLYKACKRLGGDESVVSSRMIWGCLWDQICMFICSCGDKVSLSNSSSYGNHNDSSGNAAVVVDNKNQYGKIQVTGYSDYWKANNIYDIAGNCWEWTQEVKDNNCRVLRGGSYDNSGSFSTKSRRAYEYPNDGARSYITTRPVLYLT